MKRRLRGLLKNPFLRVIPLVVILAISWQHYTYAGRGLSLPTNQNILADSIVGPDTSGLPADWKVSSSGQANYSVTRVKGYANQLGSKLSVTGYKTGDVTVMTPRTPLDTNKTYLFKGYYNSDAGFSLLAHYFYHDGTDRVVFVQDYPDNRGVWSTVSNAFNSGNNITDVQFIYRLTSNGNLLIDGSYLEPRTKVHLTDSPNNTQNLIANSELKTDDFDMPTDWNPYRFGDNNAAFSYQQDDAGPYLQVTASDFHSGEAKWEPDPINVAPAQYYKFNVTYKSDVTTELVAEYTTADGQQVFDTLETAPPSSNWTMITSPVEIPPGAQDMFVTLVLHGNGTLGTRDYSLINLTKDGPMQWKRPIASITFDDGWKSSFSNADPLLEHFDFKATFYINPASIETPSFMTADDLQTLHNQGNEIAAHGYEHDDMTSVSPTRLDFDLRKGRDYLTQAGFKITDFATPYGKGDAEVQWYAREYYATLRGTGTGINTKQNLDPYNLQVIYLENSTKKPEIQVALDEAKRDNGWVIFVYHRIGPVHDSPKSLKVESPSVSVDGVTAQFTMIHDSGIAVEPIDTAYAEVRGQ